MIGLIGVAAPNQLVRPKLIGEEKVNFDFNSPRPPPHIHTSNNHRGQTAGKMIILLKSGQTAGEMII